MALKFIAEPPKATRRNTVFTPEVIEELKANKGMWAKIDTTPQTAKKFVEANDGFEYKAVSTGETRTTKGGNKMSVYDVYVSFTA